MRTRLLLVLLILPIATGCRRVVLDERFHDSRLSKWTVIDEPDGVEGPSDWRVGDDGWLHQHTNIWGRRGDFLGRWYGTLLVAGDASWKDYEFSVKARPGDDDGFGVVFRFRDPEHFYRLLFIQDGLNGGPLTRLDRREGPDYTELWSAPRGYRRGQEMQIAVSVSGDRIRASVDRAELFEIRDGSHRSGKVGLFCFAQSGQAFDDVRVVLE